MTTKRRLVLAIVLPVAAVIVSVAWWGIASHAAATAARAPAAAPLATTTVTTATLTDGQSFDGILSFGQSYPVKGAGSATVTKLAAVGTLSHRGKSLYRQNDKPVPVFYGSTPLYRTVGQVGASGADVRVVASNLAAVGFYHRSKTDPRHPYTWTPALTIALRAWQRSVQLPDTGRLSVGQVLVLPAPARVSGVTGVLGDPVAEPLLTLTGRTKSVSLSIRVGEAGSVHAGAPVTVTCPDGSQIPGRIATVGSQALPPADDGPTGSAPPTLTVTVSIDHPDDVKDLSYSPVSVSIVTKTLTGVLAVPTAALLALDEGGYALQLPDGDLLPVVTGMFSGDLVQVSGPRITAGLKIVTVSQ